MYIFETLLFVPIPSERVKIGVLQPFTKGHIGETLVLQLVEVEPTYS